MVRIPLGLRLVFCIHFFTPAVKRSAAQENYQGAYYKERVWYKCSELLMLLIQGCITILYVERHFGIIAFHVSTFANCPLCHSTKEKPPRSLLLPRGRLLFDRFLPPILATTSRQNASPYLRGPSFPSPPPLNTGTAPCCSK